ncbi:hypothetical protein SAMN05216582_11657 [Selenomonas ruminantium]|uniref:Uncharacterized protein n=1 Tax=Selenomonas ruminantium TaxID=971 RepID=A0A1M6V4P2_SELRU|nr:hypothetical protein [Selenomonas ruminantium]SHK76467.1 hypothetical protein SAMN05216582_11657 [Selenomonas ruminantium]
MENQGFRERCEYDLIREALDTLFRKYRSHRLNSSEAYIESGNLLDYDALCAEAMFFRFYALRNLLRPEKNRDFFAHASRPEARLLQQLATGRVPEEDYPLEDDGQLHCYRYSRQELLALCSREFYGYVQDYYRHVPAASRMDVMKKIRLFEGIYLEERQFFTEDCQRYLEPYLPYIMDLIRDLQPACLPRLHTVFAKIKAILDGRRQEQSRKKAEEKGLAFAVLEDELASIMKDMTLFRQSGHK